MTELDEKTEALLASMTKPEVPEGAEGVDFDALWDDYQKQLELKRQYDEEGTDIHPDTGYVVKTYGRPMPEERDEENEEKGTTSSSSSGDDVPSIKVFINMCKSAQLEGPSTIPGKDGQEDQLRIPLSCGAQREDVDKGR